MNTIIGILLAIFALNTVFKVFSNKATLICVLALIPILLFQSLGAEKNLALFLGILTFLVIGVFVDYKDNK